MGRAPREPLHGLPCQGRGRRGHRARTFSARPAREVRMQRPSRLRTARGPPACPGLGTLRSQRIHLGREALVTRALALPLPGLARERLLISPSSSPPSAVRACGGRVLQSIPGASGCPSGRLRRTPSRRRHCLRGPRTPRMCAMPSISIAMRGSCGPEAARRQPASVEASGAVSLRAAARTASNVKSASASQTQPNVIA